MHHTDHIVPDQPRPLPEGPLYFVGIGGAGMSAIAQVLAERGRDIRGADPGISPAVQARLEAAGITVFRTHEASQIEGVAAVVVSDAIPQANPEVNAAREAGLPIIRRPEALGAIVNAGRGIAISGTHGKTTTTGMVASILITAGLDPTVLIGGDLPLIGGNARNGKGEFVVAESCEAYDGFLYLHPEIAVILNVEADHLDYHDDEAHVFSSFERFIGQIVPDGNLILNADDPKTIARDASRSASTNLITYGFAEDAHLRPVDVTLTPLPRFSVNWHGRELGKIRLGVPGRHNVSNALAAFAVGLSLGIPVDAIIAGLESFTGTGRRFERLGEPNGVLIIDDYAHHPTELRATLSAARAAYPERRIIAVFQPHLPSRTRDLMAEFAEALAGSGPPSPPIMGGVWESPETSRIAAETPPIIGGPGGPTARPTHNLVYLTDIYLAREQPIPGVSSETLAERVAALPGAPPVVYVPDKRDLPAKLAAEVRAGDIVITLGAGDIRKAGETLLELLVSAGRN